MKELGLKSKLVKKFRLTTDSKHSYLVANNLLERQFIRNTPAKAWVSDITYIAMKGGFVYLRAVVD